MDVNNRRRQMYKLCTWLKDGLGFKSGVELAKALKIPQSSVANHLANKPEAAIPEDSAREKYAKYMNKITTKGMICDKWSIATFTEYLDTELDPESFIKYLENKPVIVRGASVHDIFVQLNDSERLEFVILAANYLKKNCVFSASYA